MTSAERASLERLEDMLGRRLERMEAKIDGIDARLRQVEKIQAEQQGAHQERKDSSSSRIQVIGVILACAVAVTALPAAIYAIVSLIELVTK